MRPFLRWYHSNRSPSNSLSLPRDDFRTPHEDAQWERYQARGRARRAYDYCRTLANDVALVVVVVLVLSAVLAGATYVHTSVVRYFGFPFAEVRGGSQSS